MFERFTNQSRRVVVLAQEEARGFNHDYIGTEHLLLGLLREGKGTAARALAAADVTLEGARRELETIIGRGKQEPSGHIPFTPRAKKVLELSLREAVQLEHHHIGTGHVLLGLIREGEGVAVQILVKLGADPKEVRQLAAAELRDHPEQPDDVPGRPVRVALRQRGEVQDVLNAIDARLSAIERHLGLARPGAKEPQEGDELARARTELARLREMLREHGIDPGEPGDPAAATG